jgi:nicotinate phosphoribosyltransferase
MAILKKIYGDQSLALVADFYQFTALYAFWKANLHETKSCFHMFHRKSPFKGGYAICAGREYLEDWITNFKMDSSDIDYLASIEGNDGNKIFQDDNFLKYLSNFRFTCDVDTVPEGTVIFPHEPMIRTIGTVADALLIESFGLCTFNSQTLFATLASRMVNAANGDPVLDGGLRRAQGLDGALSATRACYIGGIKGTSNTWAGKTLGIKAGGTMQHAFIMFFDSELEAFETYAKALPNNCVFLVDTYGTVSGVKNAITASLHLKSKGYTPIGIRLDSGDLTFLSKIARQMLDEAGLHNMKVGGSNDLDEQLIASLKTQGATIASWVIGTKLITANNQPALGGVYKMGAVQKDGTWVPKIKLSDQTIKTSNPGILNTLRFEKDGKFCGDMIYDELIADINKQEFTAVNQNDALKKETYNTKEVDKKILLEPSIRNGEIIKKQPSLNEIRDYAQLQLSKLPDSVKRFDNPQEYPAGIDLDLHHTKVNMIIASRDNSNNIYHSPFPRK